MLNLVKEKWFGRMVILIKDNGRMIKRMDMGNLFIAMDLYFKDNL